jgi:hypothetical protein
MGASAPGGRAGGRGFPAFAAFLLMLIGAWQLLGGLAAIVQGGALAVAPGQASEIGTTDRAWTHLILGLLIAVSGGLLLSGASRSRGVGVGLAVLSALSPVVVLPSYPWWALLIIALNVFVVWTLVTASTD